MTPQRSSSVPVLIVGAGPAGLTAAVTLARHGVECLVVERRAALGALPRATTVSTRTMELLRDWGLEDEVLAGGADVDWIGWISPTLATADDGTSWPTGLPTREQAAVISPTAPACVPQDHLEPVLMRHFVAIGGTPVRFGTELVDVESDDGGVRAVVRDLATGADREIEARYLIAADGAYSATRAALGIPFRGPDELGDRNAVLFRAPLWDVVGDHRHGIYSVTSPEEAVFLPMGPGDRWAFGFEPEAGRSYTHAELAEKIRAGAGVADLDVSVERVGSFRFAGQIADSFRAGSAFLAGDAAHRVTPRGGTGMNTAIHGAYDLAWKLAWVVTGWAEPALLDTYEAERRPPAEHNVERSIDPDGSVREADDVLHADLGGRIPHVWVPRGRQRPSTLDLLGPGLTLFTGPDAGAWHAAVANVGGRLPVAARTIGGLAARALGVRVNGALLVRPDGLPCGAWATDADAQAALRAVVDEVRGAEAHALAA